MIFYQSAKYAVPSWKAQGSWCDVGKYSIPSSCILLHVPSYTNLDGAYVFKIHSGYYGQTILDGQNILELTYFRGSMWNGDMQASIAIFLDRQASRKQFEALRMIFSGKAGGFMGQFTNLVRNHPRLNFVSTSIDVADDFSYWAAELPKKIVTEVEALIGPQRVEASYEFPAIREDKGKAALNTVTTMGGGTTDSSNTSEAYRRIKKAILTRHITFNWSGP